MPGLTCLCFNLQIFICELIAEDALELVGKRLDVGLLSIVISQEAKRSVKVGFVRYSLKCRFNLKKRLFETNLSSGSNKAPC